MDERLRKWRMILGKQGDPKGEIPLEGSLKGIDQVLDALYDSERKGGLGSSSPNINRWLGDIRSYFPSPVVQVMQRDALDRLGLKRMLLEPELLESVDPDIHLVGTLLSLNKVLPSKTKETAKAVVRKIVLQLEKRLRNPLREAIEGSLSKSVRNRRPNYREINWNRTIQINLKHYQKELKAIIPERLIGYGKKGQKLKHLILAVDQSGSMATSVVYAGVLAAIMASLKSIRTNIVVFDTAVVDLSDQLGDPVELLFATQLGGGTDIGRALTYAEQLVQKPDDTIMVLISDLYEGANEQTLLRRISSIKSSGVQLITLLALNDEGAPDFSRNMAAKFGHLDLPVFACTPDQFPDLMATAIQKKDIRQWIGQQGIELKN